MIITFEDIVIAIKEAETTANKANKAADHALLVSAAKFLSVNMVNFKEYV